MDSIGGLFGGGGDDAGDAAIEASQTQAEYQEKALEYLKQKERLPMRIRDENLRDVNRFYQGGGQRFIRETKRSPFYQQNIEQGEQAIGRNLAMTGGLRSGNAQQALAQNSQQVLQNLVNQRLSGMQGLAQMPSNANNIANQMGNIGQTLAQGQVAQGQAQQAGSQQGFGNMMGLANLGMQAYSAFSDINLKENIKKIGEHKGVNLYRWQWNEKAKSLGLSGEDSGVIAQEIRASHPDMVGESKGFLTVDYEGLANAL